jgi:hypothetical protein
MEHDGGIVLFDPSVFCAFLEAVNCTSGNVFELFQARPDIGDSAISEGAIIPMYPIDEDDYRFVDLSAAPSDVKWNFIHAGFPLKIESGILIATDLFSLFSWEHAFFKDYKTNYTRKASVNDMIYVERGLYSVDICGGRDADGKVYGLKFTPVAQLKALAKGVDTDSFDFSIQA